MLANKIYKLYLSKSRIIFKDEFGDKLDNSEEIGDYAIPILHNDNLTPDFLLRGYFRNIDKHVRNEFILSRKGPHIVLVTGIPKNVQDLEIFKFKGSLYTSYYKDEVKGALFQVLPKSDTYIGITKKQGIKQFNF